MRLDKHLANNTVYSRKEIKRFAARGAVKVNDTVVTDTSTHVNDGDLVTLFEEPIGARASRYFMLYKPEGCVSATVDDTHLCAIDLIEEPFHDELHIAGRLDIDTTGLLLITDDGKWSQRITSPKHKVPKTYFVETADPIEQHYIAAFQKGVYLRYEDLTTKPADLVIHSPNEASLTIHEGKYHQVKRMFAAMGNKVTSLHRTKIGDISLDDDLEPGEYRALDAEEIALI